MHFNLTRITSNIVTLAKSGGITTARKLFDEMPHRDSVAWNAMLTSYSQLGLYQETLSLFHRMRITDAKPDHFSFTATLCASAGAGDLRFGMKIHSLVIVLGYQWSLAVSNSLIDMYGKCLTPCSAGKVFSEMEVRSEVSWCSLLFAYTNSALFGVAGEIFDSMPHRTVIAWNIMITGHARYEEVESCLSYFKDMQKSSCQPDQWTFSALMNACAELQNPCYGHMMHAFIVKRGWCLATEAKNSMLSFYAKQKFWGDAKKLFESFESLTDQVSCNTIIDALMKMGDTHEAFLVFNRAPEKNVVSWTSMIAGYARNGDERQSLSFFVDMMKNCLKPDDFTFGAVLHACSSMAILVYGKMVHGCVIHYGYHAHVYVGNGLINMYAKCGEIKGSSQAFDDICGKDLVSWNAMLFGFGLHGEAMQALRLYEEMVKSGIIPDKVTFIGLLMTCSHSGLIEKGRVLFDSMVSRYEFSPEMDHIACMVDMLGRGGYLTEARELARAYPITGGVTSSSSDALLGACVEHGDTQIGTCVGKGLKNLEPEKEMSYVLLSNLYCVSGKWKEAEIIRKEMADQGVKKLPGCSWIEIGGRVSTFVAGDYSHSYMDELCKTLYFLEFEMRSPCLTGFGNEGIQTYWFDYQRIPCFQHSTLIQQI